MKSHNIVRLVIIWEFLSAIGILIAIGSFTAAVLSEWGAWHFQNAEFVSQFALITLIMLMFVVYFLLAVISGVGLLKTREWEKITSIIHAAITLFWVPIGTSIGTLVLICLTRPQVRKYFRTTLLSHNGHLGSRELVVKPTCSRSVFLEVHN